MINTSRLLGILGTSILLTVVACSKESPQAQADVAVRYTSLIRHVPSDTPYLYAFNEALPEHIAEYYFEARKKKLQQRFDGYLQFHEKRQQRRTAKNLQDTEADRLITAVIHHIQSDFSRAGLKKIGINLKNEAVLYGQGLMPVFRIQLDEPRVLAETVDAILQEAQSPHTREATDAGWQLILPFGKSLFLMVAVQDKDLVLSLLPEREQTVAKIRNPSSVPGFVPLDKARLDELVRKHGYEGHSLGFLDTNRVVSLLLSPATDANRAIREALSGVVPMVPSDCEPLMQDLARHIPILHAGIISVTDHEVSTRFGVQTEPAIGQKLDSLLSGASWAPSKTALGSIGFSINVPESVARAKELLDYSEQYQGQCEWVDSQALSDYRALLSYAKHPMIQSLRGALINFNDFEIDAQNNRASTFSVDAAFFFQSTEQLLYVLKGLSPKLAELDLKSDGNPVHMEIPVGDRTESVAIVASGKRIAISMGNTEADSRARALLKTNSSQQNVVMGYAFQGDTLARKFEVLDNPPEVEQFLNLIKEQGSYSGAVVIDQNGVSVNHHLHLTQ